MKKIRPSRERLEELYCQKKLTCEKIASLLGVTASAVNLWRINYGIPLVERFERRNLPSELSESEASIVVGSTLGDGNIRRDVGYPHFRHSQCREHHGYSRWMANRMKVWLADSGIAFRTRVTECFGKRRIQHSVAFETVRHPVFVPYRNWFYGEDGIKKVPENIEDLLTPLALAAWYMDDGGYSDSPVLYTCAFSEDDHKRLQEALLSKFGIQTSVGWSRMKDGRKYRHMLARKAAWFDVVGDIVWHVACMRHKLPKGFFPSRNLND